MKKQIIILILLAGTILLTNESVYSQFLRVAQLGNFELLSGQTIQDCHLGYRTFGKRKDNNIILVPTWLAGKSENWISLLGPKGIIDTTEFYVVVIDALANGVSSSPSNTSGVFPSITIEDMVQTQYRFARDILKIQHLRAVIGISMGGMQTFEWALAYPEFADRFVSIVGTPRLPRWDRAWLGTVIRIIDAGEKYQIPKDSVWLMVAGILTMTNGPKETVNLTPTDEADIVMQNNAKNYAKSLDLSDCAAQSRAIMLYDAEQPANKTHISDSGRFDGRFLVINSSDDLTVSAEPAFLYAKKIGADTLDIPSPCGHWVFACEAETIGKAVSSFLHK